jgi:hypothetical protein
MADIMGTMTDTIKSMKESYRTLYESYLKLQQQVDKQESDIKINVDKADSSEVFKELARREERSKELILFKIDESDSKSWNETKTYERTELTKTRA